LAPRPLRGRGTLHNEGVIFAMHFQSSHAAKPRLFTIARVVVTGLALAMSLLLALHGPAAAQGLTRYETCAVGWHPPTPGELHYANIILMYSSVNYQPDIQADAAVCSELISYGWFPVSKYGEWERRNGGPFVPVCSYDWPWGDSVTAYAFPGYETMVARECLSTRFSGGSGPYWF